MILSLSRRQRSSAARLRRHAARDRGPAQGATVVGAAYDWALSDTGT